MINKQNLELIVTKPTRGNNLLDLIFTDMKHSDVDVTPVPELSDHSLVQCTLNMAPPHSKKDSPDNRPEIQRMNTKNMDIGAAKRILAEVDWEKEFSDKRVYNQKNHMIDKIAEVMKGAGATVKKLESQRVCLGKFKD